MKMRDWRPAGGWAVYALVLAVVLIAGLATVAGFKLSSQSTEVVVTPTPLTGSKGAAPPKVVTVTPTPARHPRPTYAPTSYGGYTHYAVPSVPQSGRAGSSPASTPQGRHSYTPFPSPQQPSIPGVTSPPPSPETTAPTSYTPSAPPSTTPASTAGIWGVPPSPPPEGGLGSGW